MFKLKKGQETFQVVDGPNTGKTYERGREYESIPAGEENRFEKVLKPVPSPVKNPDPKIGPKTDPKTDKKKAKENK